jgi:hypothetical protein
MWRWFYGFLQLIVEFVIGPASPGTYPLTVASCYYGLLEGIIPSGPSPPWSSFTESTWTGYARQLNSAWTVGNDANGFPNCTGRAVQWTNGDTVSHTITGVVVCDAVSGAPGNTWGVYMSTGPIVVAPGQTITFVPNYPTSSLLYV